MALQKVKDSMRTTVALDATKLAGAVPTGSLGNAVAADDSITLAKMAPGTDGQVITYSAAGDPVAIGPGTAGQVLTSAGANLPQTFATPAAGGAWTHLITTSVAGTSTAFEGLDAYDIYVVVFNHVNVNIAGAGADITMQTGTGATPTYKTSAYKYHCSKQQTESTTYGANIHDSAAGMLIVKKASEDYNRGIDGHMFIHSRTYSVRFVGHVYSYDQATNRDFGSILSGHHTGSSDAQITAIKFITSAGAFDTGNIRIYGIAGA